MESDGAVLCGDCQFFSTCRLRLMWLPRDTPGCRFSPSMFSRQGKRYVHKFSCGLGSFQPCSCDAHTLPMFPEQ